MASGGTGQAFSLKGGDGLFRRGFASRPDLGSRGIPGLKWGVTKPLPTIKRSLSIFMQTNQGYQNAPLF
jgi:hypothetical protein